jgi:hypothetical protein
MTLDRIARSVLEKDRFARLELVFHIGGRLCVRWGWYPGFSAS